MTVNSFNFKLRPDKYTMDDKNNLTANWRLMTVKDITAVSTIAEICHPDLPESHEVLAEKQILSPQTCFVLQLDKANALPKLVNDVSANIVGYILAHPWASNSVPKLDSLLGGIPAQSTTLYLHDLALLPTIRGQGLAQSGLQQLFTQAQKMGFKTLSLTSVHQTTHFWQTQGFSIQPKDTNLQLKTSLASYEEDAQFMVKRL